MGLSTYSSDERFLVEHTRHMGHWALRIKNVREDDRGFYECQLSVHPVQSIFIELRVVGKHTNQNANPADNFTCFVYVYVIIYAESEKFKRCCRLIVTICILLEINTVCGRYVNRSSFGMSRCGGNEVGNMIKDCIIRQNDVLNAPQA